MAAAPASATITPVGTSGYVTVEVEAGVCHEVTVQLHGERTRVTWDYATASKDIGFVAEFHTQGGVQVISDDKRVDSHKIPQCGSFESSEQGALVLTWVNTFSFFTSKVLTYSVNSTVLPALSTDEGEEGVVAVRTTLGLGTLRERRSDGLFVVKLPFGVGYLRRECILSNISNDGRYSCKTIHQLIRMEQLATAMFVFGRDLGREERAFCDEATLLRYLRANEWDVNAAASALDTTLRWRFFEARPFDLLGFNMELFRQYVTVYCAGRDKDSRPVVVVRLGLAEHMTTETKMQLALFVVERALQLLPAGEQKVTWVLDFKGFSRKHLDYRFAKWLLHVLQANYPERLGQAVIINTHMIFQLAWKFVKPMLQTRTRDKFVWLHKDTDEDSLKSLHWLMDRQAVANVLAAYPPTSLLSPRAAAEPAPAMPSATSPSASSPPSASASGSPTAFQMLRAATSPPAPAAQRAGYNSVVKPTTTSAGVAAMVVDDYGVARPGIRRSSSGNVSYTYAHPSSRSEASSSPPTAAAGAGVAVARAISPGSAGSRHSHSSSGSVGQGAGEAISSSSPPSHAPAFGDRVTAGEATCSSSGDEGTGEVAFYEVRPVRAATPPSSLEYQDVRPEGHASPQAQAQPSPPPLPASPASPASSQVAHEEEVDDLLEGTSAEAQDEAEQEEGSEAGSGEEQVSLHVSK